MNNKICPQCFSYLVSHDILNWKKCNNCDYRVRIKNMDLTLTRLENKDTGIFGTLTGTGLNLATLEHAYQNADGSWSPKIPVGVYTCQRGNHQLHSGPIETFEVLNVPGHTGVLIHYGNFEADSEGCILVGSEREGDEVINSKVSFHLFMTLQTGSDTFQLTVC